MGVPLVKGNCTILHSDGPNYHILKDHHYNLMCIFGLAIAPAKRLV